MRPGDEEVRRQLDRLLASSLFANAGRMRRFLRFVVEQALAGEGERLKEYVIGVEVFDRDADYDPRVDSIVRVEAARLRVKLAQYYAGDGAEDPVVLTLPKGGYAPGVALAAADRQPGRPPPTGVQPSASQPSSSQPSAAHPPAAAPTRMKSRRGWVLGASLAVIAALTVAAWVPWGVPSAPGLRVAVLPFAPHTDDTGEAALAAQLTEGLTAELVRSGAFAVVASSAARAAYKRDTRPRDLAAALAADLLIEASVTIDGEQLRVEARAVDASLEQKVWVQGFAGTTHETGAVEREMAAAIAAALGAFDKHDRAEAGR